MIEWESLLNYYYNIGRFNKPERIGFMMNMIRKLHPLTIEEWQLWYFENVHNPEYIDNIVEEFYMSIPSTHNITKDECKNYVYDVMFRRTFNGFNKEKQALKILRETISPYIQEAPKEWDTKYFIDFYLKTSNNGIIGIQLKPETFYLGNYQSVVDIEGKIRSFCNDFNAKAFILKYKQTNQQNIVFANPNIIEEIKKFL